MVEMLETAEILKHATPKSLVSMFFVRLFISPRRSRVEWKIEVTDSVYVFFCR